jgi:hypothetical protein
MKNNDRNGAVVPSLLLLLQIHSYSKEQYRAVIFSVPSQSFLSGARARSRYSVVWQLNSTTAPTTRFLL